MPAVCFGGDQPCSCDATAVYLSSTTTTTPAPTMAIPASVAAINLTANCSSFATLDMPMFLWTEIPVSELTSQADWAVFYRRMRSFITSNCVNLGVTKLILRVMHPLFSVGGYQAFSSPAASLMYTEVLRTLPSGIQVIFYPYLASTHEWDIWQGYTNTSDPVEAVFAYSAMWNRFLVSQGSQVQVSGIVLDLEEFPVSAIPSVRNATRINAWKAKYGLTEYGVSVGFDQVGIISTMASYTDSFYVQFYDFYYPTIGIDKTPSSPFLTYQNQPTQIAQYILNPLVMKSNLVQVYNQFQGKIYAMWSIQDLTGNCRYPLDTGLCGLNFEFGSWSPVAFNAFYQQIIQSDLFKNMNHGIFQFSFVPFSWLSN